MQQEKPHYYQKSTEATELSKKTHSAFIAGYSDINIKSKDIEAKLSELKVKNFTKIDIPTKKWKGYGFIEFQDLESLNQFINFKKIFIKGREIQVKKHKSGNELKKEKKLIEKRRIFVQNIPKEWTDEILYEKFLEYGEIEESYVVKYQTERKNYIDKDVGYVLFKEVNDALRLIAMGEVKIYDDKDKEKFDVIFIKKTRSRSDDNIRPFGPEKSEKKSKFLKKKRSKKSQSGEKNDFREEFFYKGERDYYKGESDYYKGERDFSFNQHENLGNFRVEENQIQGDFAFFSNNKISHKKDFMTFPKTTVNLEKRKPTGFEKFQNTFDFHGESTIIKRRPELFFHRLKPSESDYYEYRGKNKTLNLIFEEHLADYNNLMLNRIIEYDDEEKNIDDEFYMRSYEGYYYL